MASESPSRTPAFMTRLPFYYGWVILAVGALAMFVSAPGQTYVVSIFVDPIIDDLGWSRTLISGLYTGGSLSAALAVPLAGRLMDRYGGRIMLVAIAVLFGVAVVLMGRVALPFHLFLGFMAIRALGQGSLSLVSTTLVAMWFVRLRGRAIALTTLASPASQAAFPILVFLLIAQLGWRNAWVILALIVWTTLIPISLILVRRSPESVGLLPDGDSPRLQGMSTGSAPHIQEDDWTLSEALRTRAFWILLFAGTPLSMIATALTFHHISLFASKGLDAGLAAGVLSFLAPMALVGTFTSGFLADKVPNRFVLSVGQALFAIALGIGIWFSLPWQSFLYGGMLGFAQGILHTINTIIWPNYFGRAHLGSIRGVASTVMVASSALGPLPFGFIFDLTGGYTTAIMAFLGLPIGFALIALLATPPKKTQNVVAESTLSTETQAD